MVILLHECIKNNFYWPNLFVSENIWGLLRRLESLAIIIEWILFPKVSGQSQAWTVVQSSPH